MQKQLYRSVSDRYLAGVCGGLGEYFEIDSAFVRLLFVAATFAGGMGAVAYLVLALTVPEALGKNPVINQEEPMAKEKKAAGEPAAETKADRQGSVIGGLILIVLGAIFLADNFLPGFDFGRLWPLILVAIGAGLLIRSSNR
jgi:phage shock protein C